MPQNGGKVASTSPKTLREWMFENDMTHRQLAKMLKTSYQNVQRWMGATTPSVEMMIEISKITDGEVTLEAFTLDAKWAGDKRLVDAGLLDPAVMRFWEPKSTDDTS